jgi:uncharacterized membrane protein
MLDKNYQPTTSFDYQDDIDHLLKKLNETDLPAPSVSITAVLENMAHRPSHAAGFRFRFFVPAGTVAVLTFFLSLTIALHSPDTSFPTSTAAISPTAIVSATAARAFSSENNNNLMTSSLDNLDMLRVNLSVPAAFTSPLPLLTPSLSNKP